MVLLQFYGGYRGGGGIFSNFMYWLEYWGVRDVILPFILIFTIFFAVLQKIELFGTGSKKYNLAISLAISLLVIIPHVTGAYPPNADIVSIINNSIPEVALLVITVVMLLLMLGLGIGEAPFKRVAAGWVAVAAAIIVVLIFGSAILPIPILSYIDPSIQALIIILLVFALIVWYVARPSEAEKAEEKVTKEAAKTAAKEHALSKIYGKFE